MKFLTLILCVTTSMVASIRVSSNGNSPEIKMIGGMMVDIKKKFVPVVPISREIATNTNYNKSRRLNDNSTKLSINERYRRLIPYMTFYYANDLVTSTPETYNDKDIEVEKAEIIEATTVGLPPNDRQPKKIIFSSHRNIPRYQGNRLTQYNIASANPTKNFYDEIVPINQNTVRVFPNYNPFLSRRPNTSNNEHNYESIVRKQVIKAPSTPFIPRNRAPYINFYNNEESPNIRYYLNEKEHTPRYKLVPYEQTPPVTVVSPNENYYNGFKKPIPTLGIREQVYIKPKPIQSELYYDNVNIQQTTARKQPSPTISENYYEKRRPNPMLVKPIIENGFKPITISPIVTTEVPRYTSIPSETLLPYFESTKESTTPEPVVTSTTSPDLSNYYQYMVEEAKFKPPAEHVSYKPILEQPIFKHVQYPSSNAVTLGDLINSLQLNKSIPKPITRENVGASIRTLLQILNALRAVPIENDVDSSVLSTPQPITTTEHEATEKPLIEVTPKPTSEEEGYHEEEYLAPVKTPSQYLDEVPISGGTSQQFPLPITSDDEGGTPGRPGVDYPILTTIPHTSFNCKTQRYKGFFADTETRCQVWHYCDLNGGQASFLCPNGTIFSQAALTCDWWFNVRCSSTAQLYVLNESLYKFILPHSPKFPEDYSGPLVDKYLSLKFKEMEEQFKKNKKKQTASNKMDADDSTESNDSSEKEAGSTATEQTGASGTSDLSAPSVIVESPGMSGNVERLTD